MHPPTVSAQSCRRIAQCHCAATARPPGYLRLKPPPAIWTRPVRPRRLAIHGLPVFSDGSAPLVVPANGEIPIAPNGDVSAKLAGQPATVVGRLKMATPTADDPLKRSDDGLFRTADSAPLPNDPAARLQSGALEGSNVSPVETMVGMIQTARQFEMQMRLIQSAESNDRSAGQLLSLQG